MNEATEKQKPSLKRKPTPIPVEVDLWTTADRTLRLLQAAAKAGECYELGVTTPIAENDQAYFVQFCPYGQPGNRLWVRETWQYYDWTEEGDQFGWGRLNALDGLRYVRAIQNECGSEWQTEPINHLDWVVVGGESGPHARPMHPAWVRSLRDQCAAAGVPFLFKQWGEWQVASNENGHFDSDMARNSAYWVATDGSTHKPSSLGLDNPIAMVRVGKKRAGRRLDGVLHDGYPEGGAA